MGLQTLFPGVGGAGGNARSPILNAAHGGRINTIASGYGSSGSKTSWLGRRPFRFGAIPPLTIAFVWENWHAQASMAAPEVLGVAPIVHRQAAIRTAAGYAPVTVGGAVPVIPVATPLAPFTVSDWIFPSDVPGGFSAFGAFEFGGIGDYQASSCPVNGATNRPGGGQSCRYAPANEGGITVYAAAAALTYPSGYDSLPAPMPVAVIGIMPSGAQSIYGGAGDSMEAQTGDVQGWGPTGGGWLMRAAYLAGIPAFNAGVSGQTAAHLVSPNNLGLRDAMMPWFTAAWGQLGTNDFAAGNQPTAAPNGAASVLANLATWHAKFKAATGGGLCGLNTIPPRTTARGNTQHTTLADQVPDVNFGAGGMRTDLNAALLANPYSASAVSWNPAVAHASGDPVRDRMTPDGIHIAAVPLKLAVRPLAALMMRAGRR